MAHIPLIPRQLNNFMCVLLRILKKYEEFWIYFSPLQYPWTLGFIREGGWLHFWQIEARLHFKLSPKIKQVEQPLAPWEEEAAVWIEKNYMEGIPLLCLDS